LSLSLGEGAEANAEAMLEADVAVVSSGEMYERMAFNVLFTARGIEMNSRMTLTE